jgi:alpha-mannosidase
LLFATYHQGKKSGISSTTARYEKAEKAAKEVAEAVQTRRNVDAIKSEGVDAKATAKTEIRFVPIEKKVIVYVQTPAASTPCLDDAGVLLVQESIDAANASLAAAARKSR